MCYLTLLCHTEGLVFLFELVRMILNEYFSIAKAKKKSLKPVLLNRLNWSCFKGTARKEAGMPLTVCERRGSQDSSPAVRCMITHLTSNSYAHLAMKYVRKYRPKRLLLV